MIIKMIIKMSLSKCHYQNDCQHDYQNDYQKVAMQEGNVCMHLPAITEGCSGSKDGCNTLQQRRSLVTDKYLACLQALIQGEAVINVQVLILTLHTDCAKCGSMHEFSGHNHAARNVFNTPVHLYPASITTVPLGRNNGPVSC
jgi:hypothetical protein